MNLNLPKDLKKEIETHMMFLNCGLENERYELLDCQENPDWRSDDQRGMEGVLVFEGTKYYLLLEHHYD